MADNHQFVTAVSSVSAWMEGSEHLVPYAVTGVVILLTAKLVVERTTTTAVQKQYKKWIARARQERNDKKHSILPNDGAASKQKKVNETVLEYTGTQLRQALLAKQVALPAHVESLAAYCRLHGRGHVKPGDDNDDDGGGMNAVCEEFYDQAYWAAQDVQAKVVTGAVTTANAPPLYGIPISIKESLTVKGTYSTGGLACRLRQRAKDDSLTVAVIRQAGAIPLCTANVPQIMMLPETYNRIYGRSRNPWDLSRSVGGSSGGDGALVAARCVHMGIGNDVAGSSRIPACFNGIVGFKPSSTRSSLKGGMKPRKNDRVNTSIAIPAVVGPLTRCVDDAALFFKGYWVPQLFEGDLNTAPLPFDDKVYQSKDKLTIGYFDTDGWFEPCATSKRAIQEAIQGLEKAGHKCVPFTPPRDGWYTYGLLVAINAAEGGFRSYFNALEGEQVWDEYNTLITASLLPDFLRWFLVRFVLDKRRGHLLKQTKRQGKSAWELGELMCDLTSLRREWEVAFNDSGLDAVLFPGVPIPAMKHGTSGKLTSVLSYMFYANLLMWPSGVVPVTTVRPDEAAYYPMHELPENQRDAIATLVEHNMQGSAGMPMAVSIMTPLYQDEKCLRVMKEVEQAVQFSERPTAFLDRSNQ